MAWIAGIDYGSKKAGTTRLAVYDFFDGLTLLATKKNQDADALILDVFEKKEPGLIALDAPLSLPGKLIGLAGYENYFYRKADSSLKAMSPMFLGGLTARAMQVKDHLLSMGHQVIESYPAAHAERLELNHYLKLEGKGSLELFKKHSLSSFPFDVGALEINSWHDVDALLALCGALRYKAKQAIAYGDAEEGQIFI